MKLKSLMRENNVALDDILSDANKDFSKKYGFDLNLQSFRVGIVPQRGKSYTLTPKVDTSAKLFVPKLELQADAEWTERNGVLVVHVEVSINRKKSHTIKFQYADGEWTDMVYS